VQPGCPAVERKPRRTELFPHMGRGRGCGEKKDAKLWVIGLNPMMEICKPTFWGRQLVGKDSRVFRWAWRRLFVAEGGGFN